MLLAQVCQQHGALGRCRTQWRLCPRICVPGVCDWGSMAPQGPAQPCQCPCAALDGLSGVSALHPVCEQMGKCLGLFHGQQVSRTLDLLKASARYALCPGVQSLGGKHFVV